MRKDTIYNIVFFRIFCITERPRTMCRWQTFVILHFYFELNDPTFLQFEFPAFKLIYHMSARGAVYNSNFYLTSMF
jgi:hypothetical protein